MRDVSHLALLSAAAVLSLVAPVARGYHLLPGSSTAVAAAATDFSRHREIQRHRRASSAQSDARGMHRSERGWVVVEGSGLPSPRRRSARGAAFNGELRMMMMAESGAPPAKGGRGKGRTKSSPTTSECGLVRSAWWLLEPTVALAIGSGGMCCVAPVDGD